MGKTYNHHTTFNDFHHTFVIHYHTFIIRSLCITICSSYVHYTLPYVHHTFNTMARRTPNAAGCGHRRQYSVDSVQTVGLCTIVIIINLYIY